MTVRKFNYFRFGIFIIVLISIIVGTIILIKNINYKKTNEYKLLNLGYNEKEIEVVEYKLEQKEIDNLLTREYDKNIIEFLSQRFFIYDNLDKYLEYYKKNSDEKIDRIVAIINTEANIDWFDEERITDTSKNELMLVNRLYGLDKEYEVSDVVNIPTKYAYASKKISESILNNIIELCEAAKEEGFTFVVSDGYRSYKDQEKLYNSYANSSGKSEADKVVARPGHSEYETGLSFDLVPYNKNYSDPKTSEEYNWLKDNAYKYGFIFRFPKDKEYLTGFREYTWRLRYVGEDASNIIYDEDICFEEYYAFYVRR